LHSLEVTPGDTTRWAGAHLELLRV